MPSRPTPDPPTPEYSVSFEEAIAKLEAIVENMESEQLPLEELVTHYEAGSVLLKHCDSVLSAARKRIELITLNNRSEIGLDADGDLNHLSETASASTTEALDDDNDISLF